MIGSSNFEPFLNHFPQHLNLALSNMRPRTLIADDQPDVLAALYLLLKSEGYQTESVTSPAAALEAIRQRDFDLVLMDLNYARDTTSGREGLDLLARIHAIDPTLPIVVMTAWGSIELAVEAIRNGSGDFIQKPWENSHLLRVVRRQLELGRELRLKRQIEVARKEARDRELSDARKIQQRLLPREIPRIEGCEVSAIWQPAREVSGDYFDVLKFNEHAAAICIADVMGKGMPAALLMSNIQAAVKSLASIGSATNVLCGQVNRLVCNNVDEGKFITFFCCFFDTVTRKLFYTNAGHNAPILVRRDGEIVRLTEGGPVLGLIPDYDYGIGEVELKSGDRLALFTDGLTEARDYYDDEFGEERLLDILRSGKDFSAAKIQQQIVQAVDMFSYGELGDDTTLIVLAIE
ncbi:MAG: SpoIIE family protein phosphatase [Acidobacteria bacterium]|nr:SpoIIE family protein phosphatase [Acidobacteriota bacterium]